MNLSSPLAPVFYAYSCACPGAYWLFLLATEPGSQCCLVWQRFFAIALWTYQRDLNEAMYSTGPMVIRLPDGKIFLK